MKLTDEDFSRMVDYVKRNFGINLIKKRLLIEGRLSFTLQSRGFTSYKDYIDTVMADKTGAEVAFLLDKLTTNHTFFMREKEHFDFFTATILPYLESTVKDRELRIWSAGCSFGNEPYNLAMCIAEYFKDRKKNFDCRILATDISTKALKFAKEGIYLKRAIDDLPPAWVEKYFKKLDDEHYQVTDELRREIVFKHFNLMEQIPFKKPFHLISCRNVMIYFDTPTREALVDRFYNSTEEGGYLFIGHSETIQKSKNYKSIKPAIYRRINAE